MSLSKPAKISLFFIGTVIFILAALTAINTTFRTQVIGGAGQIALAHLYRAPSEPFPDIDEAALNPIQRGIIEISKQEYAKKPVSFDATVMKYSQNTKESWCADYVSWVFKELNQPLSNPNSGSWRIPGTGTMQDYYIARKLYMPASKNFEPAVGDVAIYRDHRSHVNLVVAVQGDTMTTIGGNETGHLRLNTQKYTYGTNGLSGFGLLISPHGTRQ